MIAESEATFICTLIYYRAIRNRMASEIEHLRLSLLAYEAATEPSLWPVFLSRYAELLGADAAFIHSHDLERHRSQIIASWGLNPIFRQSYHEYYAARSVWRRRCEPLYQAGHVVLEEEACPRTVLTSSEFYNDYLFPEGLTRSMAPTISKDGSFALVATPMRGERRVPFGEEERDTATRLLPHLARANLIRERLEVLRAGEEVLDGLPYGVVFLTAEGRVIYANRAAEAILRQQDGFTIRGGMLRANPRSADVALKHSIQQAARPDARSAEWPLPVLIERPSLRRAYQVLTAPLRHRFALFAGMPRPEVVALIIDPEDQPVAIPELLGRLYGLTKREAAVADRLAQGKTVEQLAEELGMRYETARTHLRRIFSKTGTSRQGELIAILARIPKYRIDA